jgi:DNA-binding transcriptional LysR family regulator
MLDPHRLRLLREFAERGTIAATAAALGYTPSAVSQQLAALEREAGAILLDRTARAAELTDAGRRLVDHAERILASIEEAEADLSLAGPTGRVTVTAFPTAAVAFGPALVRRVRAHPGLTLLLRETQREEGLRLVRTGEADVALVADWSGRLASSDSARRPRPAQRGAKSSGGAGSGAGAGSGRSAGSSGGTGALRYYPLIRDPVVLVLPRGHPAADPARPVDLDKLRDEPWLAAPAGEPSRQAVDRLLASTGGMPQAPWEFEGLSTILSLVASGIGIAALPRLTLVVGDRRVAVRELPGPTQAREVYAVARASSVRRPSVAVILAALNAAVERLNR